MKKRLQRIRPREKVRRASRRRFFSAARWLLIFCIMGSAMSLGAYKASRTSFLPIRQLRAEVSSGHSSGAFASWRDLLADEIERGWKKENRLTFIARYPSLKSRMISRFPFIQSMNVEWINFFSKGELKVGLVLRKPVALQREKGKSVCLDDSLTPFPCPSEILSSSLEKLPPEMVAVSGMEADVLRKAIAALPALHQSLARLGKIRQVEGLADEVLVFKSEDGKHYRLSREMLSRGGNLEESLDRLKTVLLDLETRGEKFSSIDLTLAGASGAGRVVVALQ